VTAVDRVPRLDLDRRRDLRELIATTFALAREHFAAFLSVSLLVVAPIILLVYGLWGRALAEGADADPSQTVRATLGVLGAFIVPALITALYVALVHGLARGVAPSVGGALSQFASRLGPALGAVSLYTLGVLLGLLLFIAPGIWLAVRWFFAPQAAVVEGEGSVAALRRSAELVEGRWFSTAGYLLASGVLFAFLTTLLAVPAVLAGDTAWLHVALTVIAQAIGLTLSALFGTLLFFSRRAERATPPEGLAPLDPIAPERPGSQT